MDLTEQQNKRVYSDSVTRWSRDEVLTNKWGDRYLEYRKRWNGEVAKEGDIGDFPMEYNLQLVHGCNLACAICHSSKWTNKKIDNEILKSVMEEAKEHHLCSCSFGMDSESFMDTELLFQAIDMAAEAGVMDILIGTNGLLLTEETAKRVISSGVVSLIKISIDAYTAETYQTIRRSNQFNRVVDNVIRMVELRDQMGASLPQIRVSFCKTYANKDEEKDFINKWERIVDQVDIQNYSNLVGVFQDVDQGKKIESDTCKDPFRRVAILADGTVQCCCNNYEEIQPEIILGNVREHSVYELWHSDKMKKIQKMFLNKEQAAYPEYCKKCLNSFYDF